MNFHVNKFNKPYEQIDSPNSPNNNINLKFILFFIQSQFWDLWNKAKKIKKKTRQEFIQSMFVICQTNVVLLL